MLNSRSFFKNLIGQIFIKLKQVHTNVETEFEGETKRELISSKNIDKEHNLFTDNNHVQRFQNHSGRSCLKSNYIQLIFDLLTFDPFPKVFFALFF